jgi:hypothetical protein
MAVTATDVLSDDDVRAVLEERTYSMYQFRRAFRDHDATGLNSNTFTFPQAVDTLEGDMSDVGEEGNYPRSALQHDGIQAEYTKDGFEVAISDEAVDDTPIDVILDITEEMAVAAEKRLDSLAYTVLASNQNAVSIGNDANPLDYQAVVDAYTQLVDDEFNPADFELYLSPGAWGDLAIDDNFNRATDQGDALARQGMLGEVFGVPVVMTNTGDLGANDGLLIDTGRYGYESTRWDREVTNYREETNDRDVFKIRHRKDFVSMKPSACLALVGGVNA